MTSEWAKDDWVKDLDAPPRRFDVATCIKCQKISDEFSLYFCGPDQRVFLHVNTSMPELLPYRKDIESGLLQLCPVESEHFHQVCPRCSYHSVTSVEADGG